MIERGAFPIVARPDGSRAGDAKLDDPAAVAAYLRERPEREFCVAPFIDYRGPDGLFRKYRIALIDGRPFACHMAISEHRIIHYHDAGMRESAEKRAEEARFVIGLRCGLRRRHAERPAGRRRSRRPRYFAIDCGETPDGKLLLLEVGVAMIVHSMDSPDLFPYKAAQMRKVRDAFRAMLRGKCAAPVV